MAGPNHCKSIDIAALRDCSVVTVVYTAADGARRVESFKADTRYVQPLISKDGVKMVGWN